MYADLRIIETIEQLPATADEYFQMYYNRAHTLPIVTKEINERVLEELRLAFFKYPDRTKRITDIAGVLTIALKAKDYTHKHEKHKENQFIENDIQNTLV